MTTKIKICISTIFLSFFAVITVFSQGVQNSSGRPCDPKNQCQDCKDNNKDGKADYDGNDTVGSGKYVEPDPSCFTLSARDGFDRFGKAGGITEETDDVSSNIIPCTNKCTFSDVFSLLNNILTFFITTLLIPIFIIMIIYAGFKYITAQGNSSKIANLKGMLMHLVGGIILILCAWLIVRTIMTTLLNDEYKEEGIEFLGQ